MMHILAHTPYHILISLISFKGEDKTIYIFHDFNWNSVDFSCLKNSKIKVVKLPGLYGKNKTFSVIVKICTSFIINHILKIFAKEQDSIMYFNDSRPEIQSSIRVAQKKGITKFYCAEDGSAFYSKHCIEYGREKIKWIYGKHFMRIAVLGTYNATSTLVCRYPDELRFELKNRENVKVVLSEINRDLVGMIFKGIPKEIPSGIIVIALPLIATYKGVDLEKRIIDEINIKEDSVGKIFIKRHPRETDVRPILDSLQPQYFDQSLPIEVIALRFSDRIKAFWSYDSTSRLTMEDLDIQCYPKKDY